MLAISSCSLACALWRSASFADTPATIHQPADNEHGSTAGKAHTSGLLRLVRVSRKLFHDVLGIRVVGNEEFVVVAIEQVGILKRELDLGQVGSVDRHLRLFAKSVSAMISRSGDRRRSAMTHKREVILHTEHVLHAEELARVLFPFILNSREETTLRARVVCERKRLHQYGPDRHL